MTTGTQILLAVMAGIPALVVAYFSLRASKSTAMTQAEAQQAAASIASQPAIQQALNDSFQAILTDKNSAIVEMRDDVKRQRDDIKRMKTHLRLDSDWHVDHLINFDNPARQIIEEVAPHELPKLVVRPFPKWEDT